MTYAASRQWSPLLIALALWFAQETTCRAEPEAPFAYKMYVTPEEGPVDPVVDRRYSAAFAACNDRAQVTQQTAQCFEDEFDRQDANLNAAWKAALGRVPRTSHPALIAAQRRWISTRDPFCKTESDGYAGGSIVPVIYSSCRVELTIRRTIWLENLR